MTTELRRQIDALAGFLGAEAALDPAAVRIVELAPDDFDARGRPVVDASALATIDAYAPRFDALLARGLAWLNLAYVGRLGDVQLVAVELPPSSAERAGATSVNHSGPPRVVADAGGDATGFVVRPPGARS